MASLDFHKFFGTAGKSKIRADEPRSSAACFLVVPSDPHSQSFAHLDSSRLFTGNNLVALFVDAKEAETELPIPDIPLIEGNTKGRSLAYFRIAEILNRYRIDRVVAVAKDAEGLFAATATADITGSPMALVLAQDNCFQKDNRAGGLLAEALGKARITFAVSASTRSYVQTSVGKPVWLLPEFSLAEKTPGEKGSRQSNEILRLILDSLEDGFPASDEPEKRASRETADRTAPYVDPSAPRSIHWSMHPCFHFLYRLRAAGYRPEFIVDVGASTGYWSLIASRVFPNSRFYLIEPLLEKYRQLDNSIYTLHPEYVAIASAAGDKNSETELNVSPDLYSSSFLDGAEHSPDRQWERVLVPVRTLDEISSQQSISGKGLLKIDVQFGEHLVLDGATRFLQQVDVICLELSMGRYAPTAKTFFEMMAKLRDLGFEYFDNAGCWRHSPTGRLIQQDAVFAREALLTAGLW